MRSRSVCRLSAYAIWKSGETGATQTMTTAVRVDEGERTRDSRRCSTSTAPPPASTETATAVTSNGAPVASWMARTMAG